MSGTWSFVITHPAMVTEEGILATSPLGEQPVRVSDADP